MVQENPQEIESQRTPAAMAAVALYQVAGPLADSASTLSECFTGLGNLNAPRADRDQLLGPLKPPFTSGRLVQLERILKNSLAAAPALNRLFSVLMIDDPGYLDRILTVLQNGSLIPRVGDDPQVFRRKEKEARNLGVADEDMLILASTPQLAAFLGLAQWYLHRRLDTEQILEGVYERLASQGEDTKGYADAIKAAYVQYRQHSAGVIEAAKRRFDAAANRLNDLDLASLDGVALDDGMSLANRLVGELSVTIDTVGKDAVASMESAFAAERAQHRATLLAAYIDTQVRLAEKMFKIMEIADKGYLLAVTSSVQIIEAAMDRVLTGVVRVLGDSVASLQPAVASYLGAVKSMPNELESGGRKRVV